MPDKRTAEELQAVFDRYEAALLVAYYHDEQPYLYSIDFSTGIACREYKYALLGCGANVAEMLAGWFEFSQMDFQTAIVTTAFIIGEVKKVDAFCGGRTNLMAIGQKSGTLRAAKSPALLQVLEDEVERSFQEYKNTWATRAIEMIASVAKRWKADDQMKG